MSQDTRIQWMQQKLQASLIHFTPDLFSQLLNVPENQVLLDGFFASSQASAIFFWTEFIEQIKELEVPVESQGETLGDNPLVNNSDVQVSLSKVDSIHSRLNLH
jgi:hypothetical protein